MNAPSSHLRTGLANALRTLRKQRALSQERLAADAELHRSFVFRLEKAEVNVSLDALERLARSLGVPVSLLLVLADEHVGEANVTEVVDAAEAGIVVRYPALTTPVLPARER